MPSSFLLSNFISFVSIITSIPIAEPAKMNACAVNIRTEGEISPVGGTMNPATAMPVPAASMATAHARLNVMRVMVHGVKALPRPKADSTT